MPHRVREAWNALAAKYCNDQVLIDRLYAEMEKKYTTSRRHYHNLQHIAALLQLSDAHATAFAAPDVMAFAIFYHDIIYNVLRKDNEPRSAQIAVKRLQALGVGADAIEQVKLYIEATRTHRITAAVTHTTDLQLFLDLDMSILAAPWAQYEQYSQQVRREYRVYPDKLYYPGRRQFLEHCLAAPHIFQTTIFKEQYEARARENMARELEVLVG